MTTRSHPSRLASRPWTGACYYKCWAGCAGSAICEALGIKTKNLFLQNRAIAKKITDIYQYTDELGRVLYEKVRYSPKEFRMRRSVDCWDVKGVRRVLYHLDKIANSTEKDIVVLEGERECLDC